MRKILSLLWLPLVVHGQTTINGGRVLKGPLDASGATSTLPHRTGSGSPSGRDNCSKPGETYFQTDAAAGQNLWACIASGNPGTWTEVGSAAVTAGAAAPGASCSPGALYLRTDVRQLYICSSSNNWQPASYGSDVAANQPGACIAGQIFLATDSGTLSYCGTGNTWLQFSTGSPAIALDGATQGSYGTLNLVTSTGLDWQLTANGPTLNIQPTLDSAVTPNKTTANQYSAGAKQSVSPNATTAGLNIGAGPLPSPAATGDLAVDSSGNLNWFDGTMWRQGAVADAGLSVGAPVVGNGGNHVTTASTTGSGSFVMETAPTISNPVITSFVNANHNHTDGPSGGTLTAAAFGANVTGNGQKIATGNGSYSNGDCVKIDANGNLVDSGAACGASAGTGIIVAGGNTVSIDPTVIPEKGTANGYAAGAKQSVTANATTAGLNLGGGTLPTNPATGDLVIDANGNLNWYDGTGWKLGSVADGALTAGVPVMGNGTNHVTAGAATGSGNIVLANAPTITTPYISNFGNAAHDHSNAANGGFNSGAAAVNAAIASASSIAPNFGITHISGNTPLSTITPPAAFAQSNSGGCLVLIADGTWSTTTSGNIASAMTAAAGNKYEFCYDNGAGKWYLPGNSGTGLAYQGAASANGLVTSYDSTHVQTPNASATLDGSGNLTASTLTSKYGNSFTVGTAVTAAPALTAPVVTTAGATGSQMVYYAFIARYPNGITTGMSPLGSITNSNATLSGSNYNIITPTCPAGATTYDVYRYPGASSSFNGSAHRPGKLGTQNCGSAFNDQASAPPSTFGGGGLANAMLSAGAPPVTPSPMLPTAVTSAALAAWYTADSFNIAYKPSGNNNLGASWADSSGNGNTLTYHGIPGYSGAAANGRPAIYFDGSSTYYTGGPTITNEQNFSHIGVYCFEHFITSQTLWSATPGNRQLYTAALGALSFYDSSASWNPNYTAGMPCFVVTLISTVSNTQWWINGVPYASTAASTNSGSITVASLGAYPTPTQYFQGYIPDVEWYNGQLSSAERAALENRLMAYYNINSPAVNGRIISDSQGNTIFSGQGVLNPSGSVFIMGDSVSTWGYGASSMGSNYTNLVENQTGMIGNNPSQSGFLCADMADSVFQHRVDTNSQSLLMNLGNSVYNNGTAAGAAQGETSCNAALMAFLAIPEIKKAYPAWNTSAVTKTGTWVASPRWNALGLSTAANGATMTYNCVSQTCLIAYTQLQAGTGTFQVTVDGTFYGNYSSFGNATTGNGRSYSPALIIIPGLPYQQHSIVVTTTNSGTNEILFFAGTNGNTTATGPNVWVGNIERQTNYAAVGAGAGSEAAVALYNEMLRRVANELQRGGLAIRQIDVTSCYGAANVHPTDAQHAQLATCVAKAMNAFQDFSMGGDTSRFVPRIGNMYNQSGQTGNLSFSISPYLQPGLLYEVKWYASVTAAASGGSGCTLVGTLSYTDEAGVQTPQLFSIGMTSPGSTQGSQRIYLASGGISGTATYTLGACTGNPVYSIHVATVQLSN